MRLPREGMADLIAQVYMCGRSATHTAAGAPPPTAAAPPHTQQQQQHTQQQQRHTHLRAEGGETNDGAVVGCERLRGVEEGMHERRRNALLQRRVGR